MAAIVWGVRGIVATSLAYVEDIIELRIKAEISLTVDTSFLSTGNLSRGIVIWEMHFLTYLSKEGPAGGKQGGDMVSI